MADAKKVSPKPVKYVFITHHHGDHDYGAAVWTEAGARTLAYKAVAEELARYEPNRWRETATKRKDVADLHRDAPEPPQETFEKSPYILKDSTRELQFLHFGWAHTRGDSFAWLPKERILATGDAAVNGPHNATMDANLGNWPKVMQAALKLKPLHVLPGHGEPGGPEILSGQAAFMTELLKAVSAEVAKGKKLEDLVTTQADGKTTTSITLPASVQNWVGTSLAGARVADAYREITQKQPNGALPHK
jgi:glyoxylase-like metal-dependent hydrolase (beta-lactamase superfamily II)